MAYVTQLKRGEALKIGEAVMILDSAKSARIVLDVDPDVIIQKLSKKELQVERYRKTPILSKQEEG